MGALDAEQLKETIEQAFSKQQSGVSYAEIRNHLESQDVPDDQISYVIIQVDEQVLANALTAAKRKKTFQYMILGAMLCLAGVVITISTYFTSQVDNRIFIIAFAPFIGGYMVFRRAYNRYRESKKDA